nr:phosphotransferase family protein [uncultured Cupriavidus sp.]
MESGDILQAGSGVVERLAAYMRKQVGPFEGQLKVSRILGGQSNPTYILDAGQDRYVLRRKPSGTLLPSAHAIEREYRVMQSLAPTQVPVPRVRVLCEDVAVLGSAFYIMDFVAGRIFDDQTLPSLANDERRAAYDELNRVMAALHLVDYKRIGLADYGREGRYVERQIERWTRQYRSSETHRIDAMETLIQWLPTSIPKQTSTTIVHGDYRLDNVVFHPTEWRIVAVLDWELSTLGDPLVDFAYHCMNWHLELGTHRTLAGVDVDSLGIPDERKYVRMYGNHVGIEAPEGIDRWPFYMAFNMFRLAAIQQGVARRARDGNAANDNARNVAARVEATAEAGLRMARNDRFFLASATY